MEEESPNPLFTVGIETAAFLASCGILSTAWEESLLARDSESFRLTEHENVAYVTFPSFHKIEGFIVAGDEYGLGSIQTNSQLFSEGLKGNDDQPALVHQGALKLFLHIMEKTDFQAEMQIYLDSKQWRPKHIIFVGHSLAGAVATLATLWALEKRLRQSSPFWVLEKRLRQSSPFCITFGSPLVGNAGLVEAVGRENWGRNFLHVVSQHDIVPRMLFAPVKSIAEHLTAIFPYWHGKVAYSSSIQDSCRTLLKIVLQYTSTVSSLSVLDRVTKTSPYRVFGTYMFCSSEGATCIDDSETVLQMLHLTLENHERSSPSIVKDCFSEHITYGSILEDAIQKSISGRITVNDPHSESSYQMGISLQLEAIGVGASGAQDNHARHFSERAGNVQNNVDWLAKELLPNLIAFAEIEWYKERWDREGVTYYDYSTKHRRVDIEANLCRVELALFWDKVIEMWETGELPSDFESQNKWINYGNEYRKLVEPLDIAYYYRTNRNGNYLSDGRHNRYKVLQKWMEAKEKTRKSRSPRTKHASLTEDSCFWAYVEEACKDLENLKQGQHQSLQNLENFEMYVTTMNEALKISPDVFCEGSRFMIWWKKWKEYKKNQFPDWSTPLSQKMDKLEFI